MTDAIVVVTPDDIALRDAAEVRRRLEAHGIQNQSMIINRFLPTLVISGVMPNVDQMIDQAGIRLLGVVPEDGVVSLSAAKGIPPAKGRAKMAFQRIASRIDGEPVPLANLKRL